MKALNLFLSVVAATFVSFSVNAQTVDDHHKKMAEHHALIHKKTTELNSGAAQDPKKHADEIGTSIEGAKKEHADMQKKMSESDKKNTQAQHDAIKKSHDEATQHHAALKQEVAKPNPDQAKVKQHSANIQKANGEAQKQHEEMKKKTGKK